MNSRLNRQDPFRLDGRMALVTGAAGYLGRAVALALAEGGATLLLTGREAARLQPLCRDVEARGAHAVPVPLDGAGPGALGVFFNGFRAAGGHLDILVNTDVPPPGKSWETVSSDDFLAATSASIARPFELIRAASPFLERAAALHGQASIINVTAPFGLGPPADREARGRAAAPHAASIQAGILGLTRVLALHLAPRGIRVNAVVPGAMLTPAMEAARPALAEEIRAHVPLGRLGGPEDVAHVVRFLAGPAAGYITGAAVPVDGGCPGS